MSLNDKIKNISFKEVMILIIFSFIVFFVLNFAGIKIGSYWIYFAVIVYFVFKLRDCKQEFRQDLTNIFDKVSFKLILLIVVANIFFSYGMLYLSKYLITIPQVNQFISFNMISKTSFVVVGGYVAKLVISPISEELIFRGVIFNKLKTIVPITFAVLVSSLVFGSFHNYGSMVSAVVFALCMCILYIKTENIIVPIFAHFLNNLFAEIIFTADYNGLLFTNGNLMILVSFLAFISLVYLSSFIVNELNSIKYLR